MTRRTFLMQLGLGCALLSVPSVHAVQRVVGSLDVANPLNRRHASAVGLLAWWKALPELGRGRTWRDLAARRPATLQNMAFPGTATSGWGSATRRNGEGEVRFNNAGWVNAGTPPGFGFANMTFAVACWFRCTNTGNDGYLVARRSITTNLGGYLIRVNGTGGAIQGRLLDSAGTQAATRTTTSTGLDDGLWRHLLMIFTTNTTTLALNDLHIYLNGVLNEGARTDSGIGPYVVPTHILTFGSSADQEATTLLTGAMDDVRFYTRGFTAQEALDLYRDSVLGSPGMLQSLQVAVKSTGRIRNRSTLY